MLNVSAKHASIFTTRRPADFSFVYDRARRNTLARDAGIQAATRMSFSLVTAQS